MDTAASDRVRVVIADDHGMVRRGAREILEQSGAIDVIAEAGDGLEAVELALQSRPDVILLDVAMPGLDGVGAARRIAAAAPSVNILMLTVHGDVGHLAEAIEAGAAGYILKDATDAGLVAAVLSIAKGESYFDPSVTDLLLERLRFLGAGRTHPAGVDLSDRETEALTLAATGLSNRSIADELDVSVRTVDVHLHNAYRKLGVTTRIAAVVVALRRGLIDIDTRN